MVQVKPIIYKNILCPVLSTNGYPDEFWTKVEWKEGNVLFNDTLNTFYLRLYGVKHMVKDHSDSLRGNPLPPHRLLFLISSVWLRRKDTFFK